MPYYLIPVFSCFLLLATGCTRQATQTAAAGAAVEDLSVAAFAEKMQTPDVVILDVRTPAETALGMIPGAREIDFRAGDFKARIAELDRDQTYLLYCRSGSRSSAAAAVMADMGFDSLSQLVGGYQAWSAEREDEE